jgi:hypothetical protein
VIEKRGTFGFCTAILVLREQLGVWGVGDLIGCASFFGGFVKAKIAVQ